MGTGNTDGFFQNKSGDNLNLQRNSSGNLQAWDGSDRISTTAVSTNAWHHVAFTRASGTARLFVDGVQALSWSSTVNYNASRGFALGYTAGGGNRMNGYISNFRVVNGTALYTGSYSVPTSPLTAVSGTALLTAKTLSIEDLSTNAFSLTNNGVTTSTQTPTFGDATVNVTVQYVSADGAWEFTNDGSNFDKIAGLSYANAAFSKANTAASTAQSAFDSANTKFSSSGGTISGAVTVPSLSANTTVTLNTSSILTSTAYTTSSTSQVTIDAFATATYRATKYLAQMSSGPSYHMIELNLIHDGTTVWLAQYGEVYTSSSLGTFDANISGGNVQLLFTPTNSTTTVKLMRTNIVV